ncbi:MAG: hypothetical protein ACU83U_16195 [Gammaproteobacteria bacterium]
MSYVLQIWENPSNTSLPTSIDAALQILESIQDSQFDEFSPKFIILAERLKQSYPDLNSISLDDIDKDDDFDPFELAWADSPLTGKTYNAVYGLGLNMSALFEDVRPVVMQEATALGLCVMDAQAGEVYLPDGKVLRVSYKAKPVSAPVKSQTKEDEEPPKNKELLAIAFERLTPLMTEHGYKAYKSKRLFKRIFAEGWCEMELWVPANMWPLHAELEILFSLRSHPISDLVCEIAYPDMTPENIAEQSTLLVHSRTWLENNDEIGAIYGTYCVKHYEQIDKVIAHLTKKLQSYLLPTLAKCQTVAEFEYYLNRPRDADTLFTPFEGGKNQIVAAYMVGNSILETLCEQFSDDAKKNNRPRTLKCIDYVRSHPRPATISE